MSLSAAIESVEFGTAGRRTGLVPRVARLERANAASEFNSRRMMQLFMLGTRYANQVLNLIIGFIVVDVVNVVTLRNFSVMESPHGAMKRW